MSFQKLLNFLDQNRSGVGPIPVGGTTDWTAGATTKNFTVGQVVYPSGAPTGQGSNYLGLVYLAWVGLDNQGLFAAGDTLSFDVEHYSDSSVLDGVNKPDRGFYHYEFTVPAAFPSGTMYRHVWKDQSILIGDVTEVLRLVNCVATPGGTFNFDVMIYDEQGIMHTNDFSATVRPLVSNVKKNQALAAFGFMMFDTNGAPATGKTVTVTRSIDAGAFAAGTLGTVTEISAGWYRVDFAAADLNGKCIRLRATATGCKDTNLQILTDA